AEARKTYKGKTVKVLVEGESKKDPDVLAGYTEKNKLVNFKGPRSSIGKIVEVEITEAKTWSLNGVMVENTVEVN
ncbi:TRAM domain-containing protein, partial [Staphylococcus sp. SIMBA_130]